MNEFQVNLFVLLIEDDNAKIEKIKSVLDDHDNITLSISGNVIAGLNSLSIQKFDLLILDMQLPVREGGEFDVLGGEKVLLELDTDDTLHQPTSIIALTQFDDSQIALKESFCDIASIKYDNTSDKWEHGLSRVLKRIIRAKSESKKVIYCEGQNAGMYNQLALKNVEFRGLADSRAIYLAAKNEKDKFAIRDRDFLTSPEITKLQTQHSNYFILEYYCIENYLYHPENIKCAYPDFEPKEYILDIVKQKNNKLLTIVQDYKISRSGYLDLTDNSKENMDKNPESEIVERLQKDELEQFYPYFDMAGKKDNDNKKSYNKSFLMKHNLNPLLLAQTSWFKSKIEKLLGSI